MDSDWSDDSDVRAAIAASLNDFHASGSNSAGARQNNVVDLTGDTDNDNDDDDVIPVFPKSKSVVGSETSRAESEMLEEEDEDLKKAIALSLQHVESNDSSSPELNPSSTVSPSPEEDTRTQELTSSKGLQAGFLGLDRKRMEEDRLLRMSKRKAEDSTLVDERSSKQLRTETPSNSRLEGNDNKSIDSSLISSSSGTEVTQAGQQNPVPSVVPSIQFPTGGVKKTFAFGSRRLGDDIKVEEVFQKSDLELAVLSSFMWDMEWLFSKLDTKSSRFILIMQAKDDATKRQYEAETANMKNLRLCFPPMDGQVNCMHSKLMLLFHPAYLRIVVPTANLVPYDWGEWGGIMENSVFLIDLPRKSSDSTDQEASPNFYKDLIYFLEASTLHRNIISKLDDFDFRSTSHLAFVHTIGGSHSEPAWRRTGYCGLGRCLDSLGLKVSQPINIDFVTSSLGSLTDDFIRSIYLAAQGDDGTTDLAIRTAKNFPIRSLSDPRRLIQKSTVDEWKDRFRVYFPSQDTVNKSKGGPESAGTVCFQSKWYEGTKFPRHVLRDCESQRQGLLMHNKILYVRPDEPIRLSEISHCRAWAYIGSANLSESAWGRLVQDRSTKKPKINCRNWECGVIVPVIETHPASTGGTTHSASASASANTSATPVAEVQSTKETDGKGKKPQHDIESANFLDVFEGTIPVPMRLPGSRYGPSRKPWYFLEPER